MGANGFIDTTIALLMTVLSMLQVFTKQIFKKQITFESKFIIILRAVSILDSRNSNKLVNVETNDVLQYGAILGREITSSIGQSATFLISKQILVALNCRIEFPETVL
ncbi:hypothetical protein LOAG_07207 [Loa loa]|uniref:Uncharacterized protein n=1 Tax=Loa loa TaxID=7209 RepID=A0A1S0TWA5_LOALO|nr:hypothetical protein LOAG_07207 [Loa loa]EFO21277.1 hypothetical protein LOAG_07207 [Loa loa]